MTRSEKLLKNTLIIGIGNFSTKFLTFIMLPFYTKWLSPDAYGEFDLLVTYVMLIISFATLQLEQAIFRFSLKNKEKSKAYFLNALFVVLIILTFISIIIKYFFAKIEYINLFIFYYFVYAIFNCFLEYLRGIDKLKKYSLINIVVTMSIIICNIILVYYLKLNVDGMLLSYCLSYSIGIVLIGFSENIFLIKLKNLNESKEMIKYSLPLIPNSVSWWITSISDRIIINSTIGVYYNRNICCCY